MTDADALMILVIVFAIMLTGLAVVTLFGFRDRS